MLKSCAVILLSLMTFGCNSEDDSNVMRNNSDVSLSSAIKHETSMQCDRLIITSKSTCTRESDLYVTCTEQLIEIANESFVTSFKIKSVESQEHEKPILDHKLSSWACVDNKYVILEYTNGGNCGECEWYELIDQSATRLTYNENISTAKSIFSSKYKELGLPEIWPLSSFTRVDLVP